MSETATRRANRLGDVFIVEEEDVQYTDRTVSRALQLAGHLQSPLNMGDALVREELEENTPYSVFHVYRDGATRGKTWRGREGVGRFLFNVGDLPREMLGGLVGIGLVSSHDQGEGSPLAAGRDEMRGSMGMAGGGGESISVPSEPTGSREVPPENPVEKARGQSWDDPPGRHVAYKVAEVVAYLEDEQFSDLYPEELRVLLKRVLKDLKAVDR